MRIDFGEFVTLGFSSLNYFIFLGCLGNLGLSFECLVHIIRFSISLVHPSNIRVRLDY